MSRATSATTGRRYGLKRVCRTWERSRSALYARRARLQCRKRGDGPARRGPPPRCRMRSFWRPFALTWPAHRSRARAIARSHARLRILDGVRVSRTAGVARDARAGAALAPPRPAR